jgi:hypothetical protein
VNARDADGATPLHLAVSSAFSFSFFSFFFFFFSLGFFPRLFELQSLARTAPQPRTLFAGPGCPAG